MSRGSRAARRQVNAEIERLTLEAERTGMPDELRELSAAYIHGTRLHREAVWWGVATLASALLLIAFLIFVAVTR